MSIVRGVLRGLRTTRYGVILGLFNRLTLLARLYGDTDKWQHGYMPYYAHHFRKRRLRENVLIEIGVGGFEDAQPGGSLRMWRDYLPRSRIVGVDIHDKTVRLGKSVAFVRADQSDDAELQEAREVFGDPSIVIDDGSHIGTHVIASFESLWPRLLPGGIYVIEDLSTSFYPSHGGSMPPSPRTAVGLLRELVESVQAQDNTFTWRPEYGAGPTPRYPDVHRVCVYPGIAFIHKV